MVVYVDVESIGIRFTSRNCEDKYKNWMECIDCKSKIDGDCI